METIREKFAMAGALPVMAGEGCGIRSLIIVIWDDMVGASKENW